MIVRFALLLGLVLVLVATGCDGPAAPESSEGAEASFVAVPADDPGAQLLERVARAERELPFSGWKMAISGPDDDGRRTRMHVIRPEAGNTFMEWRSGERSGRRWVYRQRHRWIDDPALLLANYEVVAAERADETVAWRSARRVEVRARRPGRPSMTLLVDEETSLVLAETIRDAAGVRRFSWRFESIEIPPDGEPELPADVELAAERVCTPQDTSLVLPDDWSPLRVTQVPDGFREVAAEPAASEGETVYWSDGLSAFSITQRPASAVEAAAEGDLVRQACGGRVRLSGTLAGVSVEISGLFVPDDELVRVAEGLHAAP